MKAIGHLIASSISHEYYPQVAWMGCLSYECEILQHRCRRTPADQDMTSYRGKWIPSHICCPWIHSNRNQHGTVPCLCRLAPCCTSPCMHQLVEERRHSRCALNQCPDTKYVHRCPQR